MPEGVANSCPAEPGQAARVVPLPLQQLQGTRVLNITHTVTVLTERENYEQLFCWALPSCAGYSAPALAVPGHQGSKHDTLQFSLTETCEQLSCWA